MLLVAASLLHGVEAETQPDRFGTMPQSLWWAVVTMTTVGYGDVYPQTGLGKFLGAIVALLGIGMFALPTAILGSGFLEETSRRGKQRVNTANCPHCGKSLDAAPSRSD
jgi:voltage-gated potassium channel